MKTSAWITVALPGLLAAGAPRADAGMARMCDITGNEKISSFDATHVLQFVAGTRHLTLARQLLADASGNGKVTAHDAVCILQAAQVQRCP